MSKIEKKEEKTLSSCVELFSVIRPGWDSPLGKNNREKILLIHEGALLTTEAGSFSKSFYYNAHSTFYLTSLAERVRLDFSQFSLM